MTKRVSWLAGLVALLPSVCLVAAQTPPPPPSPPAQAPPAGEMSIHQAAMKGDLATVKKLLEQNPALLEARDEDEGVTPLAYAAGFGHMELVEFLIGRGANVNARDPRGLPPLLIAVATGQAQALRFLLDKGADVRAPGPSGMSPLHFAAREGAEIAGLLIGQENFFTLRTLANLQGANGLTAEAEKTFQKAINYPGATPIQLHQYGRQLLAAGEKDKAPAVFEANAKLHPNAWPVNVGLARGYAAVGRTKEALKYAKLALQQAPDEVNKKNLQKMVEDLESGKTVK